MTSGIHHVTGITANVQKNVDFYLGFLGLRLIKQTGGYEDGAQLHLFYGDQEGRPGSLLTFLVWQDGGAGRAGLGAISEVSLAVPAASLGDWLTRALAAGVPVTGPVRELGEPVLRLRDPDGLVLRLVGVPEEGDGTPLRVHGVTILTEDGDRTAEFVRRFGYRESLREGPFIRLTSGHDMVDVRASGGFVPAMAGGGAIDHVAFRAPDAEAVRQMRLSLKDHPGLTNVHDRKYFLSLYVREPMGTLLEYATDGPGFLIDEEADHLGETLMIPPHDTARAADLKVMLPQFSRPGEPRLPARDLPFVHRIYTPDDPDGSVIVLAHGSGGSEADLMPLAHRIAPRAALLGVRGRSHEEGNARWFRRFGEGVFDQADIRDEAGAFTAFLDGAVKGYGLDRARMTGLGYSNGANFLGAVLQIYPGALPHAILLRGIDALEEPPKSPPNGSRALVVTGETDPQAGRAPALVTGLTGAGVEVTERRIASGHGLDPADEEAARAWLAET